jgi:hypothetical protein
VRELAGKGALGEGASFTRQEIDDFHCPSCIMGKLGRLTASQAVVYSGFNARGADLG